MATESTEAMPSTPSNLALQSLFDSLDKYSRMVSTASVSLHPDTAAADPYSMDRGPRYNAYAELRESKLLMKRMYLESEVEAPIPDLTPPTTKKSVRFEGTFPGPNSKRTGHSVLAQSVPDFSTALRKENRKPIANSQSRAGSSLTPPPPASKSGGPRFSPGGKSGVGSKSVSSVEKRGGGFIPAMAARKSYANVEELKGLSMVAAGAIAGENRGGGGTGRVMSRSNTTAFGYRHR